MSDFTSNNNCYLDGDSSSMTVHSTDVKHLKLAHLHTSFDNSDKHRSHIPADVIKLPECAKDAVDDPTSEFADWFNSAVKDGSCYLILCTWSKDVWLVQSRDSYEQSFLYKDDLRLFKIDDYYDLCSVLTDSCYYADTITGRQTSKVCYVLDNPVAELYEVYNTANEIIMRYDKPVPDGMTVYRCADRFDRDSRIRQLEEKYSEQSHKNAAKVIAHDLPEDAAIVVSDGCSKDGSCASSCWVICSDSMFNLTAAYKPSKESSGSTISEITGVMNALQLCRNNGKRHITCFYDNRSILYSLQSKKLKDVTEIRRWKKLLQSMVSNGCIINFVELHPKNAELNKEDSLALTYFHKLCDRSASRIADMFNMSYRENAAKGIRKGKSANSVLRQANNSTTTKGDM